MDYRRIPLPLVSTALSVPLQLLMITYPNDDDSQFSAISRLQLIVAEHEPPEQTMTTEDKHG